MLPTMLISIFMHSYSYGFQGCFGTHTCLQTYSRPDTCRHGSQISECLCMCRLMVYLSSLNSRRLLLWKLPVLCLCCVMRSMKTVAVKAQRSIPVESCLYDMVLAYGSPLDQVVLNSCAELQTGVRKQFNSGSAFWVRQRCLHGSSKPSVQ